MDDQTKYPQLEMMKSGYCIVRDEFGNPMCLERIPPNFFNLDRRSQHIRASKIAKHFGFMIISHGKIECGIKYTLDRRRY